MKRKKERKKDFGLKKGCFILFRDVNRKMITQRNGSKQSAVLFLLDLEAKLKGKNAKEIPSNRNIFQHDRH